MFSEILAFYTQHANTVRLIIVGQGLLLILLIVGGPYGKRLPGYLIAVFIAIQSNYMLMLCIIFSYYTGLVFLLVFYVNLTYATLLLLGPLFYFYCKSLMIDRLTLHWSMVLHVLPACIAGLILPAFLGNGDMATLNKLFNRGFNYVHMANFISLMIYSALAIRMLSHHRKYIHDTFSALDDISLAWLSWVAKLCFVISAIVLIAFATRMIMDAGGVEISVFMRVWSLMQFLLIAFAGCRSQLQLFGHVGNRGHLCSEAGETPSALDQDGLSFQDHTAKYGASKLDNDSLASIRDEMHRVIEQRALFLDPNLNLPKLADALSLSRHDVSQVINAVPGQNFYDLINNYRAKKARELIEANAHSHSRKAMLDIALEAGFSNTVTLNKYFKKLFSLTPAKYKKAYLAQQNAEIQP